MQIDFRNKDFWAGLMLLVIGAGAAWIARNYPMGTVLRMGAGYFPTVLGILLALFGVALMARALRSTERIEAGWSPRAFVLLPLSFIAFGFLLDRAGFIPAMVVLIVGAAAAGREFRLVEVLLLAVGLTAASVAVFIYGLRLPYPLIVGL